MLKFRCEMSIGNESWKCTQAVQIGLSGGHKCTPVKHKHMLLPSACSSPLITEDLPGSWPGQYMRMDSPQQHSLYCTTVCPVPEASTSMRVTACYQPGQATWLVGSKVYVCWSVRRSIVDIVDTASHTLTRLPTEEGRGEEKQRECLRPTGRPLSKVLPCPNKGFRNVPQLRDIS